MGAQEEGTSKRRDFQKRTDEDIDVFLGRPEQPIPPQQDASKPEYDSRTGRDSEPVKSAQKASEPETKAEMTDEEHEMQIKATRASRAQAEAYHDVAVLRKKAHQHSHKASQFYHKYRMNEARAAKCTARAVAFREKSAGRRERAKGHRDNMNALDAELRGAAQGKGDLSPEALRTKMANMERKAAKEEMVGHKYDKKASIQTERAAKYRSRALKHLEQNKLHESEARMFGKRADNLEKAGT